MTTKQKIFSSREMMLIKRQKIYEGTYAKKCEKYKNIEEKFHFFMMLTSKET